ncbi:hypothetical protein ES708_04861 [subsurface metagenome]
MPGKSDLEFLHRFQKVFDLVRSGKIKGVQLRLDEKPGQTIAKRKEVRKNEPTEN